MYPSPHQNLRRQQSPTSSPSSRRSGYFEFPPALASRSSSYSPTTTPSIRRVEGKSPIMPVSPTEGGCPLCGCNVARQAHTPPPPARPKSCTQWFIAYTCGHERNSEFEKCANHAKNGSKCLTVEREQAKTSSHDCATC